MSKGHLPHPQLVEGALMVFQQQSPLLLVLHSGPRAIVDKSPTNSSILANCLQMMKYIIKMMINNPQRESSPTAELP
jgi:hypothetical protein